MHVLRTGRIMPLGPGSHVNRWSVLRLKPIHCNFNPQRAWILDPWRASQSEAAVTASQHSLHYLSKAVVKVPCCTNRSL